MNVKHFINLRNLWSRVLMVTGSIGMLVGALDPMEGSVFILFGSALVASGALLGREAYRVIAFNLWVFALVAFGVVALWVMSAVGGIGGASGRSMWWGALILPYLVGWSMGVWRPGSPIWLLIFGFLIGALYILFPLFVLSRMIPVKVVVAPVLWVLVGTGVLTLGGCICRLRGKFTERK